MAYSEKLSDIIALGKCEVYYTNKPIYTMHNILGNFLLFFAQPYCIIE